MFPFGGGGYTPDDEGPEARMAREIQAQHEKDCKMVDCLLASLRVEDSLKKLIPFSLIKKWNLKRRARRVDDC